MSLKVESEEIESEEIERSSDVLQQKNIYFTGVVVSMLKEAGNSKSNVLGSRSPDTDNSPPRISYNEGTKAEVGESDSSTVKRQIDTCVKALGDRTHPTKRLRSWFATGDVPEHHQTWVRKCGDSVAVKKCMNLDT